MKISDIIIITDLDGTVIPNSGIVSKQNISAISRFRAKGGIFTIATGRSPFSAKCLCDILGVNSYFIANNGATIFDVEKNETIWCQRLDSSYKNILHDVKEKFDFVGIQAITDDDIYHTLVPYNSGDDFVRDMNLPYKNVNEAQLPDNCCKVLFQIDDERFDDFANYMYKQNYEMFNFVKSGGDCFEMMASNISKGYPLEKLANFYGKTIENTAAIGDFYNDIEMIKKAKIGCAVNNAPQKIKDAADIIVASCEENGLAEFIDYLINKFKSEDI